MKNKKLWVISILLVTLFFAVLMMLAVFIIDPYNYFRWGSPRYFQNGREFNAGIIRNYGANEYVIGSSMIYDIDVPYLRENGLTKPVKLTMGGMNMNEILLMLQLIEHEGQTPSVIVNFDINTLTSSNEVAPNSSIMLDYLYNTVWYDDWQYFFNYEVWYRYLPMTVLMIIWENVLGSLPSSIAVRTDIDNINDPRLPSSAYNMDVVVSQYLNGRGGTTELGSIDMEKAMRNVDSFVEQFAYYTSSFPCVVVGYAPYSALYWYVQNNRGVMDDLLEVKAYLNQRLLDLGNVRITDFQAIEEIANLEHYKDQTHFDRGVQAQYTDALIFGGYDIDSVEDIEASNQRLREIVDDFAVANSDWL